MTDLQRKAALPPTTPDETRHFAIAAARVVAEYRCTDVVIIDLRGLSSVADYFVVATGTSDRQMRAALTRLEESARQQGRRPFNTAKPREASWILLDFVDVIVHLFDVSHREYYDLDGLWGDAPRVEWSDESAKSA